MSDPRVSEEELWPRSTDADRTARRALDAERRLGVQVVGFDWRFIYVNPAAARHGRREAPRDLVGLTMLEAYPGIDKTAMFERLARCMTERADAVFEHEFTFDDGSRRWFEIRVQAVPEGLRIYSRDIERWKKP
jgi:hypothetical protein